MQNRNKTIVKGFPAPFVESSNRWVRVKAGDDILADCKTPLLLIQYGQKSLPTYFFPVDSIDTGRLVARQELENKIYWDIRLNEEHVPKGAWCYAQPPVGLDALAGHISFTWWHHALAWYEEEQQVFAHAKDPYHRVDVLPSSRHIQIKLGDRLIAESRRPFLLFETNLPTRYYLPREDVNENYLEKSSTTSYCPYKGQAQYWHIKIGQEKWPDLVWSYKETIPENPKVKDLLAFFNEKVDIILDGVLQEKPHTFWS